MQLNALHMRFGAIAGGVVLIMGYAMCGGSWGDEMIVQIDFSMAPEQLEGVDVEIDGEVVGKLESYGQANRTGFEVAKGTHTVCLKHPDFACEPLELTLDKPGQKARLLAEFSSTYDSDTGEYRPVVYLKY